MFYTFSIKPTSCSHLKEEITCTSSSVAETWVRFVTSKRTATTVRAAKIEEICGVCTNLTDSQSSLLEKNFVLNSTFKV